MKNISGIVAKIADIPGYVCTLLRTSTLVENRLKVLYPTKNAGPDNLHPITSAYVALIVWYEIMNEG